MQERSTFWLLVVSHKKNALSQLAMFFSKKLFPTLRHFILP
jgi:hypothetical protein